MRLYRSGGRLLAAALLASCNGIGAQGFVPDEAAARKIVCDDFARRKPPEVTADMLADLCLKMTARLHEGIWAVTIDLPPHGPQNTSMIVFVSQKDGKLDDKDFAIAEHPGLEPAR
jgi:hypothetical protein